MMIQPEKISVNYLQKEFLNRPVRWLILLAFIALFGVLVYGGLEAKKNCVNQVTEWFPEDFPETQKLNFFKDYFGSNEMVMISWEGLSSEDPFQETVASVFKRSPGLDASGEPLPPLVRLTLTTSQMLRQLDELNEKRFARQKPPKPIHEISMDQLHGWLLSRNRKQGCILVMPSKEGSEDRASLLKKLYDDTMLLTGLEHHEIHLAGGTCDSVAIDEATKTSQRKLFPIFGITCSILLALCLRNPILSMTVFCIALFNEEIGPAVIFFTGSHMDSISLLVSALTFVLSMESGIHLANYYRDSVLEGGTRGAVRRTIQKGWLPCTLATITTVLGMGSLAISQVKPICNFGIYSSISLTLGTLLLFLFLASYWENWPPFKFIYPGKRFHSDPLAKQKAEMANFPNPQAKDLLERDLHSPKEADEKEANRYSAAVTKSQPIPASKWHLMANFISKFHWGIILLCAGLLTGFIFMVSKIETSITLHGMLKPSNEVILDYNYLEENFGGLVPVELIIRIPKTEVNQQRTQLENLELVSILQKVVDQVPGIDASISILNLLPSIPSLTDRSNTAVMARRFLNRELDQNQEILSDSHFFSDSPEEEMWRISMHVPAGADLKYESLLSTIELKVYEALLNHGISCSISDEQLKAAPYLSQIQKSIPKNQTSSDAKENDFMRFENVSLVVTGAIPLVFKAQQQLLKDLIDSFLMAFGLISATLIILQRSVVAGLVAMFPNILPSIVIFGVLAFFQIKIDIGSMMTASVALGITVDGTLHLLTWFQRGITLGYARKEAVIYAYTHCADAMLQTTFICSFTFLVFAFSDFVPVARFAWMLCVLLAAAVSADLFLTPALLISPLGKFFVKQKKQTEE